MTARLHVCRDCPVAHYDNCPDCFGFGQGRVAGADGHAPISAARALGDAQMPAGGWRPCPTCGSTPVGVPEAKP